MIFKGYKDPPPLVPYPSFFEYNAYALVAFLFPYSWNYFSEVNKRIALVSLYAIGFTLVYVFILNLLEWSFSFKDYKLLSGYIFSLYHSGLIVLLGYSAIAVLLGFFGVTESSPEDASYLERLTYKLRNETFVVNVLDIVYFESNDNYVSMHFKDGSYQLVRKPLAKLEKRLNPNNFQRIHRKFIVNLQEISSIKVNETGGTEIDVSNGKKLSVSKTYRSDLRAAL